MENPTSLKAAVVGAHLAARALDDFCDLAVNMKCTCTDEGRALDQYCPACEYEDFADDARHELYALRGIICFLESRLAPLPKPLLHFVRTIGQGNVNWDFIDSMAATILDIVATEADQVDDDHDGDLDLGDADQGDVIDQTDTTTPEPVSSSAPALPSSERFTLDAIVLDGPAFTVPPPSAN